MEDARSSAEMLRLAVDALQEGILVFGGDGQVCWANPRATEILGMSVDALRSVGLDDWAPLDTAGRRLRQSDLPVVSALAHGQARREVVLGHVDPTGRVAWLSVNAAPFRDPASGEVCGAILSFTDITERRRVESAWLDSEAALEGMVQARTRELQDLNAVLSMARDKAQAATGAKSAFLAHMSHEIRTPMNAIIGLTHLMRRDAPPPRTAERLARVADAAAHLLGIVNDILDLSRIESGKLVLDKVDFNIDTVLARACAAVAASASDKGIELLIDSEPMPPVLRGDAARISQALVNLLSNAVKFTDHGSISVRAQVQRSVGRELLVRFEVRDTGVGIEAARIEQVFSAFEQGDATTTRRFGGAGLGLGITRHLARLMAGDAGAESTLGVGSTFWFTAALEASQDKPARSPDASLAGRHALLVDDMPEVRELLGTMLGQLGLRAQIAASGAEAIELADAATRAGDPFDVVLIDWLMPHMDGIETARGLLARHPDKPPACIIVSGLLDPTMREQAFELGITCILQKPLSFSALRDQLLLELVGQAPALPNAVPDERAERALRERHGGARVLLAEDNPVNQEVATSLLEQAGLRVDLARTGHEAVEMASANAYALVLMDMQMPVLDGIEATLRLRAQAATAHVPIVAMTANAHAEDSAACLAAGMNDHLAKPVDPPALYRMLLRWMPDKPPVPAPTPHLNTVRGLAFFGGNRSVYRHALAQFAALYGGGIGDADAYLAAPTAEAAGRLRRELHSIAGAAATLGAESIAKQAAALGEQLRSDALAPASLASTRAFQHAMARVVDAIRSGALADAPDGGLSSR